MFKQIVIKPIKLSLMLSVIIFGLAACGQKGPLQPEPMPEQNEPSETGTSPTEKNGAV
ncbi:LPS translocon maturation chaperone LptM [Idiomarina seosinensis]|uniref:Lipoprotein n=1 Tax=Idiomarina seosinensis TaxID=281739 RepID=A0A432Z789_9GAMM|nr:hypothetical protein CWI81_11000 [Idiomarina seosinensis]